MSGGDIHKDTKEKIAYLWGDDHLLINMGNHIPSRIKALFWAEFVLTCGMATIFLLQSIPFQGNIIHWLSGVGAMCLYALASYRFLLRMLYNEKMLLDKGGVTIIQRSPFFQKHHTYIWEKMGPIRYAGKSNKTDHPLKGQCYDYFGFETQEQLIQNLHHDGNLTFEYDSFTVRFAKGIYSWDAEEMISMMKLYAGSKLKLGPEWAAMAQQYFE
jgi:hypothetical protein